MDLVFWRVGNILLPQSALLFHFVIFPHCREIPRGPQQFGFRLDFLFWPPWRSIIAAETIETLLTAEGRFAVRTKV